MDDCPLMMAERRRFERFTAPALTVVIDGQPFLASSWSLGGVVIEGYRGRLAMGALLTIDRLGNAQGDPSPVKVRARVVRRESERRQMALNFLDLDERAYGLLQECLAERMRVLKELQDDPLPDERA